MEVRPPQEAHVGLYSFPAVSACASTWGVSIKVERVRLTGKTEAAWVFNGRAFHLT